jgi:hypothetical protein
MWLSLRVGKGFGAFSFLHIREKQKSEGLQKA